MLPIFAVFDARWHSGRDEVSARDLIAAIEAAATRGP